MAVLRRFSRLYITRLISYLPQSPKRINVTLFCCLEKGRSGLINSNGISQFDNLLFTIQPYQMPERILQSIYKLDTLDIIHQQVSNNFQG